MSDNTYLIVGLGNPGKQYEATRHNIGFIGIEYLGREWSIDGKQQSKFEAIVGKGKVTIDGSTTDIILAEPTTYMNLSGKAVSALCRFYQVPISNILILFDDAALPFGKLRFRPQGSAGGHNGIKSIIADIGTDKFCRLKIGVGTPKHSAALKNHVLGKFSDEENKQIDELLPVIKDAITTWLTQGNNTTMNKFNNYSMATTPSPSD